MTDDFNQALWELASASPDLQEAIKRSMHPSPDERLVLPNEDMRHYMKRIEDEDLRKHWLQFIETIFNTCRVKDIARMQDELRKAIKDKDVESNPILRTLKKVNVFSLIVLLVIEWQNNVSHEDSAPAYKVNIENATPKGDKV